MKLKIRDAYRSDAGRGVIRIDPDIINELNLRIGDVIEIVQVTGGKKTAALLYKGKKEDKGTGIIRMDGSLRRNINASLDTLVEIRKVEAALANNVTFAGLEEIINQDFLIHNLRYPRQLARKLENRVITRGDIFSFYFMDYRVELIVVDYIPKSEAVRIHLGTKIIISDKSYKQLTEIEAPKSHL